MIGKVSDPIVNSAMYPAIHGNAKIIETKLLLYR